MRRERFDYYPVLLAVAVTTVGVMPAFLTGGLAVQVRDDLGFDKAALGLAVATFFAISALTSAVMGQMVERMRAHHGMRLATAGSAASLLGVATFAHSWAALVAWLVLGGLANAIAQPVANLSLAREVPAGRQGLSFGIKQSAMPAATLMAGLAVPGIALTIGWRWAYVGGAALALIVALLVPTETAGGVVRAKEARAGDLRTKPLVLLTLGVGLGVTAAAPLGVFTVETAVAAGIEVGRAGLLLALGSVVGIFARVLSGYFVDRMTGGRLRLVAAMLGAGVLGFVMLATGMSTLLVIGTVLAFGVGWGWPGIFTFAIVKTSPGAPAAATGITQTGISGGAALGPFLFGLVLEETSYTAAWLVSGALAFLAAAVIFLGRQLLLRDRATMERR